MNLSNKKVLVTGGAGFIGSNIVKILVDKGNDVRVVDDLSRGEKSNLDGYMEKIEFLEADLCNKDVANKALKDVDVCFHLAAKIGGTGYFHKFPATCVRNNVIMTLNLWDAAKETKPMIIYASSSSVFSRSKTFPTSEEAIDTSPPPLAGYAFSKLSGEYVCKTYCEEFDIPYNIVRIFNTYGPRDKVDNRGYSHVIPDLVKKILSGQYPLEILGDGKQTRSYTYVDDTANAMVFIAENAKNDHFNIGNGIETSVIELASNLWELCERKEELKFRHLPAFKYDVRRRVPDVSKINKLGWKVEVPLEEGLGKTVNWLKTVVFN